MLGIMSDLFLENAAFFQNGARRFKGVNVKATADKVQVLNMQTDKTMAEFDIIEVAKDGMAWDVTSESEPNRGLFRVVAQLGCGCSGMKSYHPDETYSGALGGIR